MFKFILIALIIFLAIFILYIILIVNRRQATQIFSIQTFLGKSSYNLLNNEPLEQNKSLIEKINDYFNDKDDDDDEIIDDGHDDIGDGGDDAGE